MRRPVLVSPSYRRAGKTTIRKVFGDRVVFAVHEFEEEDYREEEGGEILAMPDGLQGNMARVRNWILDRYFEEEGIGEIVCVDDDLTGFGHFHHLGREDWAGDRSGPWVVYLSPKKIEWFIKQGFLMARELGVFQWGVNLAHDPMWYMEYTPFSFTAPILGPFSAIRKNPLRYDPRLGLNEDYDYFVQQVFTYRKILRFNKYWYMAPHLQGEGGVTGYRTMEKEREQAEIMQGKWGPRIVSYDFAKSPNPRIRLPIGAI